jgi:hypothetical protein
MIFWTGVTSVTSTGRASSIKLRGTAISGQAPVVVGEGGLPTIDQGFFAGL